MRYNKSYIWNKYSYLEVTDVISIRKRNMFVCKCMCWNEKIISPSDVCFWKTKSCWCYCKNLNSINNRTHWMSNTRIYKIYVWIIRRCEDGKIKSYQNYGWRWIKCEWKSFEDFYRDMSPTYQDNLSIDRIDVNWNYCKENCRWSTIKEQANNKRNTIKIWWLTVCEISDKFWLKKSTIYSWIYRKQNTINNVSIFLK